MKNYFKKITRIITIKNLSYPILFLNLMNFILGILYILFQTFFTIIWNIFGILLLINIIGNILLIYLNSIRLNKTTKLGTLMNYLCYIYLMFINISILLILFGNFSISTTYSNSIISNFGAYIMVFSGYFGILFFGIILSYLDIKHLTNKKLWISNPFGDRNKGKKHIIKKILKVCLGFICVITLLFGSYLAYNLMLAPLTDSTSWWIGILFFPFSLSLFIILLSTTVIFIRMINRFKRRYLFYGIAIFGLILSTIFLLPLFSTPYISLQAKENFSNAFGEDWKSKIDPSVKQYFDMSPFTITEYFLGNIPKQCNIDIDIPYYTNESEEITLLYDAYYPKTSGSSLPGNNSVIINIHGGAWVAGDKGSSNMLQVNKYFAAQGYVIFDIQYGLKEGESDFSFVPAPDNVKGNFSLDDQLKHIGNFTKQLNSTQFDKYNLNLNSVFITGNSAGGHLSLATALLIKNGSFTDIFSKNLNIKGVIPLYPGDPPESLIDGRDVFRNPEDYFINSDSPPCLIFQGTKDFCSIQTKHIKNQYEDAGNDNCCIIWFPFQGHANDLYYSGHFNHYKLYYMERFLYLCVHNKID